jgi:hypothetical protein
MATFNGFETMVLTNNALVATVNPGSIYSGGSTGLVVTPSTAITCGASTTTYIYFLGTTVQSSTTGFPPACFPISIVTTGAAAISGIVDVRSQLSVDAGALFFSSAGVVTTCNSTVQNIVTWNLPAGILNTAGKTLRLKAYGLLNTSAASGLQVGIQLSGTNACLINTANISTSLTNQPWGTEMMLQVANVGVNGNLWGHGTLFTTNLTSNGAAVTSIYSQDTITAVSANINLTGALTFGFIGLTNGTIANLAAQIATLEILN